MVINSLRATSPKNLPSEQKTENVTEEGIEAMGVSGCLAPMCGKCGSPLRRNGKTSSGAQKYCCKNPNCKNRLVKNRNNSMNYNQYITSTEWRSKHKDFLKSSHYRCAFFPWVKVGKNTVTTFTI
jgi:transposase-like protein